MPNYNFECQNCHESFEVRATIKEMEEGKISCVKCKSKNIKRIFNGFGVGSGGSSFSSCSSGSYPT